MEIKLNLTKDQLRTLTSIAFKYVNIGGFSGDPAVLLSIQMTPIWEVLSMYLSKSNSENYVEQEGLDSCGISKIELEELHLKQKKRNFENMMTIRRLGTRNKEACDRDIQRMREEIKQNEDKLNGNN